MPDRKAMDLIGAGMVRVAREGAVAEETRAHLAERVIVALLRDFLNGRAPFVPIADVQQMLRMGGMLVRAMSADAAASFLEQPCEDRRGRYFSTVRRLLLEVWPPDRSLRGSAVSKALSRLPAAGGTAFAAIASDISDLLTPFDAWSLFDYRLYRGVENKELLYPNDADQAAALLVLLDRTIGEGEDAVIPMDLSRALTRIAEFDPKFVSDPRYARLSTLARRR